MKNSHTFNSILYLRINSDLLRFSKYCKDCFLWTVRTCNSLLKSSFINCCIKLVEISILTLNVNFGKAQPYYFVQPHGQGLHSLSSEISTAGWIFFPDSANIYNNSFVDEYKLDLGLGINDSLGLDKIIHDSNYLHELYVQYYKGLIVEGAELTVHSKDSVIYLVNGKLIDSLDIDVEDFISPEASLDTAFAAINANEYDWEVDTLESYPTPELILAHIPDTPLNNDNYLLCYKILINGEDPLSSSDVYINATTGRIAFMKSNISTCNGEKGTGETNFYGTQPLSLRHRWLQDDYILENCEANYQTKYYGGHAGNWSVGSNVIDDDGDYHGDPTNTQETAVIPHWAAGVTYEIYKNVFGLDGMEGNNNPIRIYAANLAEDPKGPFFNGDHVIPRIYIGYSDDSNLLDVLAHEWTHGVTRRHCGLVFEGESGYLNESFSDIFGKIVEWREANEWTSNGVFHPANLAVTPSWEMGFAGNNPQRSLSNPNDFKDPDTYEGAFWCTSGCDFHGNAGVQNHWFYLLSEGLDSVPTSSGIGLEKASRIAYRNLMNYIQSKSDYVDSRMGAIQATRDLFGICSEEDFQNQLAWSEVGLGDAPTWCLTLIGPNNICLGTRFEDEIGEFHVTTIDNATITWFNLNHTWTYEISGNNNENLEITDWGNTEAPSCIYLGVMATVGGVSKTRYIQICFENCEDHEGDPIISPFNNHLVLAESNNFDVFPNPFKDELFIQNNYAQRANFTLYDLIQDEILRGEIKYGLNRISLNQDTPSGTYFLRIFNSEQIELHHDILILNN